MKLKVKKKVENARIDYPSYLGDAGYDVYSLDDIKLKPLERINAPLGLSLEFDSSHVCLVQGRSGNAKKLGIDTIGNVIDSSYRGEIHAQIFNISNEPIVIKKGSKIAQLIFIKISNPEITFVDNLSKSERNENGFGSTGI